MRDDLIVLLAHHIGRERGVSAQTLARALDVPARRVRILVTQAREDGVAICAHPRTGYFIAANEEELERYYIAYLRSRALHSLKLIAIARRVPLPELIGQMRLAT